MLFDALGDENKDVQYAVSSQLGRIGGPAAIAALIEVLRDPDANKRRHAACGLSYAADAAAIPALLEAVHDAERSVRRYVIEALVKCAANAPTYDAVLPALIEALDDEYDQVAINATEGLAMIRDPRATAALVRAALTNEQDRVRAFSRKALGAIGAAAAPDLREAASSPDPRTVYRAINLLKEIHDEYDFPMFIEATRHEAPEVRNIAVCALWDNRVKEGVPALIERLNDDHGHIREVTAGALAEIRDPRAIPALVKCLDDDEEEELVNKAAYALLEIGTREARTALRVWNRRKKK
jgi:HEAT repeat protein